MVPKLIDNNFKLLCFTVILLQARAVYLLWAQYNSDQSQTILQIKVMLQQVSSKSGLNQLKLIQPRQINRIYIEPWLHSLADLHPAQF